MKQLVLIRGGLHGDVTIFIHGGFSFVAFFFTSALHSMCFTVHVCGLGGNCARGTAEDRLL